MGRPSEALYPPTFPVVVLASSAGGLKALMTIFAEIPQDCPAAFLVVQHVAPTKKSHLAEILGRHSALPVKAVEEGDRIAPGRVFVAPPDHHLLVNADDTLSLGQGPKVRHVRPAADVTLASVAEHLRDRAIAVVLTGADSNGAAGVRSVKVRGGSVIAQDKATSQHFAMPRAAIETGAVDFILPIDQIAAKIIELIGERTQPTPVAAGSE